MSQCPHTIDSVTALREIYEQPAEGVVEKNVTCLDSFTRDFIALSPLLFVSTANAQGQLDVSPKGDAPGFVHVIDERTLLIPDRRGNNLVYGFQNIIETGYIGLIFVVPGVIETVRVNGRARLTKDPVLLDLMAAQGNPALLATEVSIEECFFHCGKAFIRSKAWQDNPDAIKAKRLMGQQMAHKRKIEADAMQAALDDAYKNRLY